MSEFPPAKIENKEEELRGLRELVAAYQAKEKEDWERDKKNMPLHLGNMRPAELTDDALEAYRKYYLSQEEAYQIIEKNDFDSFVEELQKEPEYVDELLEFGKEFIAEYRGITFKLSALSKAGKKNASDEFLWAFLANKVGILFGAAQAAKTTEPK